MESSSRSYDPRPGTLVNVCDAALERLSVARVLNYPWLPSRLGEVNLVGYIILSQKLKTKKKNLHLKKASICVVLLILEDLELILQCRLPSDL